MSDVNYMNILVTLDSNYIYPLCVMLRSLSETNFDSRIDLYVVHSSLTDEDFDSMETALNESDHAIHPVKVDDDLFSGYPVLGRISKETYYRLLVGDILPESVERILYLDPDIVINSRLEDFYSLDMKGNIIAGATHLYGIAQTANRVRLGMSSKSCYINAGVMLIDLKKWRETVTLKCILQFISENHRKLLLADQDVVNVLFEKYVLPVDERIYNLDEKTYKFFSRPVSGEKRIDLDWVRRNSVIIHFNGGKKPWKEENYAGKLGEFFERYDKP